MFCLRSTYGYVSVFGTWDGVVVDTVHTSVYRALSSESLRHSSAQNTSELDVQRAGTTHRYRDELSL